MDRFSFWEATTKLEVAGMDLLQGAQESGGNDKGAGEMCAAGPCGRLQSLDF